MRKLLTMVLCLAVLLSSAIPFAGAEEAPSGKIVFVTNRTDLEMDGTFASYVTRFQEAYPDVEVEIQGITDYAGEMATRMQTAEYGDVLMIPDSVPANTFSRYFEPLGTPEELGEKYREEYLKGGKYYDGQVYGLMNMGAAQGIVYNKAVFEQAGITELPTTPEDFIAALHLIKEKTEAIPYYTNANSGWTLDQWEAHTEGTLTGDPDYKNNKLPMDAEAFAPGSSHYQVAELLYNIVSEGLCEADPTTADWEASKGMLNRGEIGAMLLGSWAVSQIKGADEFSANVGYMPYPATIDGVQYASAGPDYCYAINVNSENKAAARAWIDFLVDESGLAVDNGGISLLKSDPMPSDYEDFANVTFVVNNPATAENDGKLDEIQQESDVVLYDGGARLNAVVDIARGVSSQSFEDYMKDLNDAWAAAIQ